MFNKWALHYGNVDHYFSFDCFGDKVMSSNMYTQEQLDIALLKQKNEDFTVTLHRIESNQRWILGLMGSGFLGLLGIIAHGFKWF